MNDQAHPPSLRQTLPFRLRAAGIHFSLSLVVFGVALYLILVRWYPGFHFGVDGGWQGVRIMAAVDLVLGPLLTLIIFNPLKPRSLIAFDLACIGVVQVAALAWGFYAIGGQRPVSLNFYDGIFYSMPAQSLRAIPDGEALLQRLSGRQPALLYVAVPATPAEHRRAAERAELKLMAHEDAHFFRPLAEHWDEVRAAGVDPATMEEFKAFLPGFLAEHGGQASDYVFLRYQGGYGSCLLAFGAAREPVGAFGCAGQ